MLKCDLYVQDKLTWKQKDLSDDSWEINVTSASSNHVITILAFTC